MQWSSKHVFERDDSHAISCAISRQEKGWFHKCIARFLTYSSPGLADTWFPSLPSKECTGVRYVITKFSRMDSLPNFLTHGAPLARFTCRSSAIKFESAKISITGDYCSKSDSKEEDRGKVRSFALREDEAIWKAIHCQQGEAKRSYSGFVTFVII